MNKEEIALQLTIAAIESDLLSYIDSKEDNLSSSKMAGHNAHNAQVVAKFYKRVLSELSSDY